MLVIHALIKLYISMHVHIALILYKTYKGENFSDLLGSLIMFMWFSKKQFSLIETTLWKFFAMSA